MKNRNIYQAQPLRNMCSQVPRRSAALKSYRKACMILRRFSKAASCRLKAYKIEEVFDILTLSFLSSNAIVFTSCNEGGVNPEIYVVSGSIYALILTDGDLSVVYHRHFSFVIAFIFLLNL